VACQPAQIACRVQILAERLVRNWGRTFGQMGNTEGIIPREFRPWLKRTEWGRVLLDKLTVAKLVENLPEFYGT